MLAYKPGKQVDSSSGFHFLGDHQLGDITGRRLERSEGVPQKGGWVRDSFLCRW